MLTCLSCEKGYRTANGDKGRTRFPSFRSSRGRFTDRASPALSGPYHRSLHPSGPPDLSFPLASSPPSHALSFTQFECTFYGLFEIPADGRGRVRVLYEREREGGTEAVTEQWSSEADKASEGARRRVARGLIVSRLSRAAEQRGATTRPRERGHGDPGVESHVPPVRPAVGYLHQHLRRE